MENHDENHGTELTGNMQKINDEKARNKAEKSARKRQTKKKFADQKAFNRTLTTTSRNHYAVNRMVDRKARIVLSINALILSFIIGKIIINHQMHDFKYAILFILGISSTVSLVYSMLAINLEKAHGSLTVGPPKPYKGNPLFFGNFQGLTVKEYEDFMMSKSNDIEYMHRALVQDIFYLGERLEKKRKYLKCALYILIIVICFSLFLALLFRMLYKNQPLV